MISLLPNQLKVSHRTCDQMAHCNSLTRLRRSSVFFQGCLPRFWWCRLPATARQYGRSHEPRVLPPNRRLGSSGRRCSFSWSFGRYVYVDAPIWHGKKWKSMESSSQFGWTRDQEDLANRWRIRGSDRGQKAITRWSQCMLSALHRNLELAQYRNEILQEIYT